MAQQISVRDALPDMSGASGEYRVAREELLRSEVALMEQIRATAARRGALPQGPQVRDYTFVEGDRKVKLSELFTGSNRELIIWHLMYWAKDDEFCPMCSMWIDGLNGVAKHIERRANIAVITR